MCSTPGAPGKGRSSHEKHRHRSHNAASARPAAVEGVVLRRKKGGPSATFTVRKLSYGVGVERVFATESPTIAKLEIKQRGHVRRSRIYYLRELKGKKARLRSKVRDLSSLISEEAADAKNTPPVVVEPGTAAEAAEMEEVVAEETAPEATAEATEESEKTES
ncbi:MAG: 50S ribosomal protein L19 [Deltaproteobacteria bacterium]|nr:50S ribosomal protein L19 [Deltaproteobacteria bacterium]